MGKIFKRCTNVPSVLKYFLLYYAKYCTSKLIGM